MSDPNLWINKIKERPINPVDPESIFTGRATDVPSVDEPPNASNLVEVVQASDDAKSPFTTKSLSNLFGSKYESTMSAVKTIATGFGGSSLAKHLSHMGFGAAAKSLLSGSGIGGTNLPKFDPKSFIGKTSYSYREYENLISDPAANLPFNTNAQGFPSISLQYDQDSDISEDDLERLNNLRKRVHQFVINWKTKQGEISDNISSLNDETLKQFKDNFVDGYYDERVVGNLGNLSSEIASSSQFLQSFAIQTERFIEQNENIPDDVKEKIEKSISDLTKLYETAVDLKKDGEQILDRSTESLKEFSQEEAEISPISYVNGMNRLTGSSCSQFMEQFGGQLRNVSLDGHSSVSRLATSYSNKGPSARDAISPSLYESPKRNEMASPAPGRTQEDQETYDEENLLSGEVSSGSSGGPGGVGPLTSSDFEKYKTILGKRESGNDYSRKERKYGNYLGRWQFGATALASVGFVKRGTSNRGTRRNSTWTGRLGVNGRKDWLSNKNNCQDIAMKEFTRMNYKYILNSGTVKRSSKKDYVAGMLATSHLLGAGAAKKLSRGRDGHDGNGTRGSTYLRMMRGKFS